MNGYYGDLFYKTWVVWYSLSLPLFSLKATETLESTLFKGVF